MSRSGDETALHSRHVAPIAVGDQANVPPRASLKKKTITQLKLKKPRGKICFRKLPQSFDFVVH